MNLNRYLRSKVFLNIFNLGVYQVINYLAPLIAIPYVLHKVGPIYFGILSFAQSLVKYFEIISDYGFNVTGTQKLAIHRNDIDFRNRIYSDILIIKTGMFLLGFIALSLILFLLPQYRSYISIFYYYYLYLLGPILISNWFYLGMEEMKYLNIPNLISKLVYVILIILLLKKKEQFYLVPIFFSASYILAGIVSFLFLRKKYLVRIRFPNLNSVIAELKDGWDIFLATFMINAYRNINIVILGIVSTNYFVGIYSAAEKIIKIIQSIINPINQALYPFISRKFVESEETGNKYIIKLIVFLSIIVVFLSIFIYLLAPFIIKLISSEFVESVTLIRIMSFVIFFGSVNYVIGIIYMSNVGMKKQFLKSVFLTGVANVIICTILAARYDAIGAGISFFASEIILFSLMVLFIRNKKKIRVFAL